MLSDDPPHEVGAEQRDGFAEGYGLTAPVPEQTPRPRGGVLSQLNDLRCSSPLQRPLQWRLIGSTTENA